MPPKKKVPARRASGKHVRIGDRIVIPSPAVSVSTSGRSLRQASVGINYKLTRDRITKTKAKNSQGTQDASTAASPKRRGRPPANTSTAKSPKSPKPTEPTAAEPVKRGRGRPKRSSIVEAPPAASPKSTKRKREADEEPASEPPKKRGRPPKAAAAAVAPSSSRNTLSKKVEKPAKGVKAKSPRTKAAIAPPVKRGRPAGSKNKDTKTAAGTSLTKAAKSTPSKKSAKAGKKAASDVKFVEGLTQADEAGASDYQYWLMKAEPDTRIEKGVDVAYPIDKLATATEPEPWDGVRNPVARNNMRAMRKGDLAFFYHSNCAVPGIVGVMRIAEEHSIDESAFDPTHPYFDEKSNRDKPKWDCVKVEFVKKFEDIITLKTLKSTPELADMKVAMTAYGRLSVQNVSPAHWQFVLNMAGEPEDLGVASVVSGYEADTNGETDKELVEDSIGTDDDDEEANKEERDDMDIDDNIKAAYGVPEAEDDDADKQLNGNTTEHAYDEEIQAEKDRVEAIDAFAKEIASGVNA